LHIGNGEFVPSPSSSDWPGEVELLPEQVPGRSTVMSGFSDYGARPELPDHRLSGNVPAIEVLFDRQAGLQVVGLLSALLQRINEAYCYNPDATRLYKCPAYEVARERLWQALADDYICGLGDDWHNGFQIKSYEVEKQLEFLLGQCEKMWRGDLLAIINVISSRFLLESSLERPDTALVMDENDIKARRPATTPDDDVQGRHPPHYDALAATPMPLGVREPALTTAQRAVDAADHVAGGSHVGVPPWSPRGATVERARHGFGPFPVLGTEPTSQVRTGYMSRMQRALDGRVLYEENYQAHPSPLAQWDAAFCASQSPEDDECFPRVTPLVGYTHRRDGTRLLDDRGRPLPGSDAL